jgi:hypothetical protein
MNESELKSLLDRCQDVAYGLKATDAELLKLVTRVREIESKLNL